MLNELLQTYISYYETAEGRNKEIDRLKNIGAELTEKISKAPVARAVDIDMSNEIIKKHNELVQQENYYFDLGTKIKQYMIANELPSLSAVGTNGIEYIFNVNEKAFSLNITKANK